MSAGVSLSSAVGLTRLAVLSSIPSPELIVADGGEAGRLLGIIDSLLANSTHPTYSTHSLLRSL